jgi:hypothetical protein
MSAKHLALISVSLGLNLVLLVASRSVYRRRHPSESFSEGKDSAEAGAPRYETAEQRITNSVIIPFNWKSLESSDYETYISNLRKVHCPEATLSAIVERDLHDGYLVKRAALFADFKPRFWELTAMGLETEENQLKPQLSALEDEVSYALEKLVHRKRQSPFVLRVLTGWQVEAGRLLNFLPPERRLQLLDLTNKARSNPNDVQTATQRLASSALSIEKFLTPDELTEYTLRTSRFPNICRKLYGFEATENDLRAIAQVYVSVDKELQGRKGGPVSTDSKTNGTALLSQKLTQLLGKERFAAFQRSQEPDFRPISLVAQAFNLPTSSAIQVHELKRSSLELARELRDSEVDAPSLRLKSFELLQRESYEKLYSVFGSAASQAYLKLAGDWLSGITNVTKGTP